MAHFNSNIFSICIDYFTDTVRFVFCDDKKDKWINPSVELSHPDSYVREGKTLNFIIRQPSNYIVLDQHLELV
jgi:hypothetical protein